MDEKNPQNQQSFESGNPQDALDMIRLRLLDEQDLPSTIADLALFYEKSEDFHTAGYLYKTAIDLLPSNKEFLEARVRCEASITQKIREAETGRPRAHRLIFGFTLVIVSALIVLGSLTYFFADFADVLLDLEIRDYSVHIAVGGVFFGLIGLYHILKYITKRILHWRKVRLAQGEDFSDDRHIPCRVCTLRYKRVLTICPYCKSPQKEPQIVSQPEDNAQQEIPLTDAVQSPIIPIPEPGAIIFSATPDDITVALPKDNPFSYNPLDQKTTETVSDSPDSESKFGFIPNTARNQKNNIINNRQWLGIIGSLVLIFAVFTPIFSVGILGNISYFQNGRGDGVIVLILAIISLVIVLVRKYKVLWFTGIGIALMLTLTFIAFQIRLSNIKAEIKNQGTENMFSDTAESLTESIMMQWGCGLLIIGTILIIACAAMKDNNVEYQSVKNSSTDKNKL